ncbi:MAG: copper resistance protein CopC/CopD [Acidimicrobiia bacterium]|nr:copper resistance protein CopC/CopD [Acidimicrobiia bacterium]
MSLKALLLSAFAVLFMWPGSAASAHAEFLASDPPDGATLTEQIDTVTLAFSGEVATIGEGFTALDSTGTLTAASIESTVDGAEWRIGFDRPPTGSVVVRWEVKAPDAHPFTGSIGFSVPGSPAGSEAAAAVTEEALREFARTETSSPQLLGAVGRIIGIAGVMLSIGALAFAGLVVRGYPSLVARVMYWVRRTALLIPLGAAVEFVAQIGQVGSVGGVVFSTFGVALGLRVAGGMLLLMQAPLSGPPVPTAAPTGERLLVAAGHVALPRPAETCETDLVVPSTSPDGTASLAAVAMLVGAFLFDGHTVTEGSRVLTGLFDAVHVLAGAVWVGGVAMLAVVLWSFRAELAPAEQARVVLRFSTIAAVAVVGVAIGGIVLAITILDGVSDLWSTQWGRALAAKTALAAVAGACGAYNHRMLIPDLERGFSPSSTLDQIRVIVAVEVTALLLLLAVTGWLVGASS